MGLEDLKFLCDIPSPANRKPLEHMPTLALPFVILLIGLLSFLGYRSLTVIDRAARKGGDVTITFVAESEKPRSKDETRAET